MPVESLTWFINLRPLSIAHAASGGSPMLKFVIYAQRFLNVVIGRCKTTIQHDCSFAKFPHQICAARSENQCSILALLKEFVMTLPMKILITNHDDLVD